MPQLFEPKAVKLVKILRPKPFFYPVQETLKGGFFFILHAGTSPPPRTTVDELPCRQPKSSLEQSSEPTTSLVLSALSIFFSTLELDSFFLAQLASMPPPHHVALWQPHRAIVAEDSIGDAISYAFGVFGSIFFSKRVRRFLPFAQMCSHRAFNPSLCFCSCFF